MKHLSLSKQLMLLSGIPLLALLAFAVVLADRTYSTWSNAAQTVAMERLINAIEEYTIAIPDESIISLGAQDTNSEAMRAKIPAARIRTNAAIAKLRKEAARVALKDQFALDRLHAALSVDIAGNRLRTDAGTQTLLNIVATLRPATQAAIELIGRLAVLSTDATVSRLMLAYNVALTLNDALLLERNVYPRAGADGKLVPGRLQAERIGVGQQALLTTQFERLVAPELLPLWDSFKNDKSAAEVAQLRRTVLGLGPGGTLDPSGLDRWSAAMDRRLNLMAPVLAGSSAVLRRTVAELKHAATLTLTGFATLVTLSFIIVYSLVWTTRKHLSRRLGRLSSTMRRLARGDLETPIPSSVSSDELGEMEQTLAVFKASLVERHRLAGLQAEATAALLDEKERLRVTLHAIGDGVVVSNPSHRVTMMNAAAETLTGWTCDEALQAPAGCVVSVRDRPGANQTLVRRDGTEVAIDVSEAIIPGQDGSVIGTITVLHDMTESRRLLERIQQLAHYDPLTGLPNRTLLNDSLSQALANATRHGTGCALLFLDMDRFKQVNDTLGHAIGDMLLREVGQRLSDTVRRRDSVARLGGDEFVVILADVPTAAEAAKVGRAILQNIAQIDCIAGHDVDVSFSIGIALYPHDAETVDELLMRADAAMYQAKEAGRNNLAFFDPERDRVTQNRVHTRLQLSRAPALQQLRLLYQPKVDLRSSRVIGAEALVRWHPEPGRIVMPADFIPVAEESGLIQSIDFWVIREACRQSREWRDNGLAPLPVSVNVSMRTLHGEGLLETISDALYTAFLPASAIEIEVTESAAMTDPVRTEQVLQGIRALGVRVSLDDFGTGFSSLSQLRRLPVDNIKIDRAFIASMVEVQEDAELVRAIVGIAETMRKPVVAEGVETRAQRELLVRLGCLEAQGYLFSPPIGPAEFATMIRPKTPIPTARHPSPSVLAES